MSGDAKEINYEENFVKRERRKKQETKKKIEELRAALPVYTLKDIREYRLPYYQAMLLELEEEGFIHSLEYVRQLFQHEIQQKIDVELHSGVWSRPFLIDSPVELRFLKEALVAAEVAHLSENYTKEIEEMIKVSIHFSFNLSQDWWWLGEELLLQAVDLSTTYKAENDRDAGKLEAWARYLYGKFLIENAGEFDPAERELTLARELSSERSWYMKQFFPGTRDTLYMNISRLLYVCAMRQARFWAKTNKDKAAQLALKAKKRATEACYHNGETEALLLKGFCELESNDPRRAISNFNKAYYIQAKLQSPVGMCEARVQLSKAYLIYGSPQLALQNLISLKETAERNNLPFYLAQGYRYLGEYYLDKGEAHKATPLLGEALDIFCEQKSVDEGEQVRNLQAISAGLELMPGYIGLLKATDRHNPSWFENIMKLVHWKDSRQQFWEIGHTGAILDDLDAINSVDEYFLREQYNNKMSIRVSIDADDDYFEMKFPQKETMSVARISAKRSALSKSVSLRTYDSDQSQYSFVSTVESKPDLDTNLEREDTPVEIKALGIIEEYVDKKIHVEAKKKKRRSKSALFAKKTSNMSANPASLNM